MISLLRVAEHDSSLAAKYAWIPELIGGQYDDLLLTLGCGALKQLMYEVVGIQVGIESFFRSK